MSGTTTGGEKSRSTILTRYGEDFYVRIGREGGRKGRTGGFASNVVGRDGLTGPERARAVGVLGGQTSKRGKAKKES